MFEHFTTRLRRIAASAHSKWLHGKWLHGKWLHRLLYASIALIYLAGLTNLTDKTSQAIAMLCVYLILALLG